MFLLCSEQSSVHTDMSLLQGLAPPAVSFAAAGQSLSLSSAITYPLLYDLLVLDRQLTGLHMLKQVVNPGSTPSLRQVSNCSSSEPALRVWCRPVRSYRKHLYAQTIATAAVARLDSLSEQ